MALMLGAAACGSGSEGGGDGDEKVTLTLANVGGETITRQETAFFEPFEKETGIKTEALAYTNIASQVKSMVDSGKVIWDIVHAGADEAAEHCGTLFEKVDYSDMGDVYPEGTVNECSVPGGKYSFVFVYDTEAYKSNAPTKIADFFDTEGFPGKRIVRSNNVRGPVEIALLADGVAPDDLYPLDIDRALKKLETIKKDLIFVPTWGAMAQQLTNKQGTMAFGNVGSLADAYEAGATIAPVFDVNVWDFDSYVIPKGSPHKKEAIEAIKFFLQKEPLIAYSNLGGLPPVRTDIPGDAIDWNEGRKALSPFGAVAGGEDRGVLVHLDTQYWLENQTEVAERYVKWQAS